MKPLLLSLFLCSASISYGQFFVQKLSQYEITNAERTYVITNDSDTLTGRITSISYLDSAVNRLTMKIDGEKQKLSIEQIKAIHIIPNELANYEDMALIPVLKSAGNEDFIEVLPEDGWVIYEKMRLPGRREQYILTQLLNPGFDSKVKVYAHPDATSGGSGSMNGLTLTGQRDNMHFVSVKGGRPFPINEFNYRKRSLNEIYGGCSELSYQKLRWKDFAKHMFTYDQKCE